LIITLEIIHAVNVKKMVDGVSSRTMMSLRAQRENHYCNKEKDIILYDLVKKVWEHSGTDLMLGQVYHHFMSQKSELLHQQITQVAPKDKHFSSSMACPGSCNRLSGL